MSHYQILLVDDEPLAIKGLENGVDWRLLGIERLYKAGSMREALDTLCRSHIDLMICDIEMPGGSGMELIKCVKEKYPDVQCIFYTCHVDFNYCQKAIQLGALDYVIKPIPYYELEDIIKKALKIVEKGRKTKDLENIWDNYTDSAKTESPVEKVKQIIMDNLSVDVSRDELAARVYMSPDYLTKLFKKETGSSLSDYITKKRINLAEKLLRETDMNMVEISEKSGFSYSSYFIRIFKKKTGITPQQYREENR